MSDFIAGLAAMLDNAHLPGGCDTCDAYQTLDDTHAPIYLLTIHHDDDCPTYQQMEAS